MKNKFINRITSLLLVFIMVFTMLPLNVFAEGNNSEHKDQDMNNATNEDTYVVDTTKFFGWRFSLYFAEGLKSEAEITASTEF